MKIDAIWQPDNQQRIFRALMEAMARPGTVHDLSPWLGGAAAWRGVLASLLDAKTSLADCHQLLDRHDWPLLQADQEEPAAADYLLCQGNLPPTMTAKCGSLASPDQSATVVLHLDSLGAGSNCLGLRGPGIKGSQTLPVTGLDARWHAWRQQHLSFPLGIDMILVDQQNIAAIPRTTRLEMTL